MTAIPMDRFPCGCGIANADGKFYYDPCEKSDCPVAPQMKDAFEESGKPIRVEPRSNWRFERR